MRVILVLARNTKLFAILLFVALAVSGCRKQGLTAALPCGYIQIVVDPSQPRGVDHKVVYLCTSTPTNTYTITWVPVGPNVKSFTVEFVGPDLPFGTGTANTTFGTGLSPTTPTLPDPGELTVFKYNLTIVDATGPHHFDPHVVGGGGH
jgi:hypothetical protein